MAIPPNLRPLWNELNDELSSMMVPRLQPPPSGCHDWTESDVRAYFDSGTIPACDKPSAEMDEPPSFKAEKLTIEEYEASVKQLQMWRKAQSEKLDEEEEHLEKLKRWHSRNPERRAEIKAEQQQIYFRRDEINEFCRTKLNELESRYDETNDNWDGLPPQLANDLEKLRNDFHRSNDRPDVDHVEALCDALGISYPDEPKFEGGATALIHCIRTGDKQMVNHLLQAGAKVDVTDATGATPLMWAATASTSAMLVQMLLEKKADVNTVSMRQHETALMWAVKKCNTLEVKQLLAANAEVDARNTREETALMIAADHGFAPPIQALVTAKAGLENKNKYGSTALMSAAYKGRTHAVEVLLASGAYTETTHSRFGSTALIMAAVKGHTSTVQALLAAGANTDAHDEQGHSALYYADEHRYQDVSAMLTEHIKWTA